MNIQLKIKEILEPRKFVNKKGEEGCIYSAVGETLDQYPRMIKFDVFYDERWTKMNLMAGNVYDLQIEINSRSWNDKWFTSVIAQSATQMGAQSQVIEPAQVQQPVVAPQVQVAPQPQWNATTTSSSTIFTGSNDLPF